MQEKQKYADIERQNAQLRTDYEALCVELDRKQLSNNFPSERQHEPSSDRDGAMFAMYQLTSRIRRPRRRLSS